MAFGAAVKLIQQGVETIASDGAEVQAGSTTLGTAVVVTKARLEITGFSYSGDLAPTTSSLWVGGYISGVSTITWDVTDWTDVGGNLKVFWQVIEYY